MDSNYIFAINPRVLERMSSSVVAKRTRVFHIEDYRIMRDGVRLLLEQYPSVVLVGQTSNAEEFFELQPENIDVLLVDIFLDGMKEIRRMTAFDLLKKIKEVLPSVKVMIHSAYDDAARVQQALELGAVGFISKKSGFEDLHEGIERVVKGDIFLCQEVSSRIKNLPAFLSRSEHVLKEYRELFSRRERDVLMLLAEGKTSRDIAALLSITSRTVETHRKNMLEKLEVNNTVELVARAASMGLLKS